MRSAKSPGESLSLGPSFVDTGVRSPQPVDDDVWELYYSALICVLKLLPHAFICIFSWTFLQQSLLALCAFAVTLLAPAGWIMHHIPEYKQRSSQQP